MGFSPHELERYAVEPMELLVCEGGEAGRCAVYTGEAGRFMYQKALHRVRPYGDVSPYFLQCWLELSVALGTVRPQIAETTIQHLPLERIVRLEIPLPPIAEQHRIVAAIDEPFSRLDAAAKGLERVRANLKRYRAAVLKAACEGRLVPTEAELARAEGREYEPAHTVLDRILADRQARRNSSGRKSGGTQPVSADTDALPTLPSGWCWATVSQLGEVQLGRQRSPKNRSAHYPTKYLRAANLTWKGLNLDDVLDMDFAPHEVSTYRLLPGDILVSEASGSADQVGKPAIWRGQLDPCCFQNTVIRCRPQGLPSDYFYVAFLHYALNGYFAGRARGVGIHHLGAEGLATTPVPVPPLAEQQRIVAEVERRLSVVEKLEATVEEGFQRAARLRQAILKRACEGRLVPQDPNDEPASLLLERIRAERAARQPARPGRTRGPRRSTRANGARQLQLDETPADASAPAST